MFNEYEIKISISIVYLMKYGLKKIVARYDPLIYQEKEGHHPLFICDGLATMLMCAKQNQDLACYEFEPSENLLKSAKKKAVVTYQSNLKAT